MNAAVPRRYKAHYASSMAGEIRKNVILNPGEEIILSGSVRERKNWLIAQPRLFAITPRRIILLEHNLFTADWILEIPRSSVTRVSNESLKNGWVEFSYLNAGEMLSVRIQPMLRVPSQDESRELFSALDAFHRGELHSTAPTLSTPTMSL
jgi:hypothetical protein